MTKKLQIVRVDNDLVQKANLLIGNNIIGRGAATGVSCVTDFFARILYIKMRNVIPREPRSPFEANNPATGFKMNRIPHKIFMKFFEFQRCKLNPDEERYKYSSCISDSDCGSCCMPWYANG